MRVTFSQSFTKSKNKAPEYIVQAFEKRLALFLVDVMHQQLHNHALHGRWEGRRSINITGNWRALYRERENGSIEWIEFVELGTHSELYG